MGCHNSAVSALRCPSVVTGTHVKINAYLRSHDLARAAASRITQPLRQKPLPVLSGRGQGLRLRVGSSTLVRVVSTLEAEVEEAFLSAIKPGATVYDIGANVGWFSLLAAREVGPEGRVIAFEPSVTNASILQSNANTNGFGNVAIVPAAVCERDGWGRFSATASLVGALAENGDECVPLLALDSWIAEMGETLPDVVKIDVEGAEARVLRGMAATLRKARPVLVIELHDTADDVANLLDEAGYQHSPVDAPGPTRSAPWWAHIVARPNQARFHQRNSLVVPG